MKTRRFPVLPANVLLRHGNIVCVAGCPPALLAFGLILSPFWSKAISTSHWR
jgi:hypothetical protein